MKKYLTSVIGAICLAVIGYAVVKVYRTNRIVNDDRTMILLVYNPSDLARHPGVVPAYASVLQEEGVAFRKIETSVLISLPPARVRTNNPVIIFPDSAAQELPSEMRNWVREYLAQGGNIAVIYDAGIRTVDGAFLDVPVFDEATGVNYMLYRKYRGDAYQTGSLEFRGAAESEFFQVPAGKLANPEFVSGYAYGTLKYPFARNEILNPADSGRIYADMVGEAGQKYPALVIRRAGKGTSLYANIPLGYLKSYSDDLLLRVVMRTFLFRVIGLPHLMSTPGGRAGLVINWHVDANPDWKFICDAEQAGILRPGLAYSIHITAGDFRDKPGDGLGFDAGGKGRPNVEQLMKYGDIGCHGGWAHNWFAANLNNGSFGKREAHTYILKNREVLENITGYRIDSYSAPTGVHPQPMLTRVLEKEGFIAYYYTGDTGSAPNRTFASGKEISDRVIAFPIMPYYKNASLYEMSVANVSQANVRKWLLGVADYVEKNRAVRLIYSHFRDVQPYQDAFQVFLDRLESDQKKKTLLIKPMSYFAKFMLRRLKTDYSFRRCDRTLRVELENPEGLEGITVAVPRSGFRKPEQNDLEIQADDDYYYLTILDNKHEKVLVVDAV